MAEITMKNGYYTIIAPYVMRAARKYKVYLSVHRLNEPCQLKLEITGDAYNDSQTIELQANEVKLVEFDVPANVVGEYKLKAQGLSGLIFEDAEDIKAEKMQPIIFIQTDKGMYSPGDVVNYRIICLDENLKPTQPFENTSIVFVDAKNNRIKEIKNFDVVTGVHTGKFEISEFPVLGHWILEVNNDDDNQSVSFEVNKYVLPKYEVKVEATEKVSVRDGDVQVVVKANYTYGKPVNAKVTLDIDLLQGIYFCGFRPNADMERNEKSAPKLIKTLDMLNGVAKFDFNVKEYAAYMPKTSASMLNIKAIVEEDFTGVKLEGIASTMVYPYRYAMHCISYDTAAVFHADKEVEVKLQVQHVDGTPLLDTSSTLNLIYTEAIRKNGYWREDETTTAVEVPAPKIENQIITFQSQLDEQGYAIFKISLPNLQDFKNYQHYFEVELEYADEKRNVFSAYPFREPEKPRTPLPEEQETKDYFRIETKYISEEHCCKLGESLKLKVSSSVPLTYFNYIIVGRGKILVSERIEVTDDAKEYELSVIPTLDMAPNGKVYAYYVDEHGEFQYDDSYLYIDVELPNKLEITAAEEVKPGEDVTLSIKTAANSFVGLLAIDQSVLQLRENNDFISNELGWRLNSYDIYAPWNSKCGRPPGHPTGLITLTNAVYKEKPHFYRGRMMKACGMPDGAVGFCAPQALRCADTAEMGNAAPMEVVVRKDFAETWIFDNIENTESEEFTWVKKIPDTITSWVVNGFAINPEKGIGVMKEKTKIRTFQPFFIAIRLPYSVKRGEVINVPALVFNYLEQELNVEVTLDNADDEYDFLDASADTLKTTKRSKTICVGANSSNGVSFLLRPKTIGNIMLKFTAISTMAGDAIHKTLKVVPEGVTQYANRAYFVNLRDETEFKESFELVLPEEFVRDSQFVEFSVIGDLLGPMLKNIDHLVRLPMGCCEQTTSTLVPNYLVLRYLKSTGKLLPALESKIMRNLETGYQHLLSYRLDDGSFCSFLPLKKEGGEELKPVGSSWLTAYVIRSLYHAKQHITIDAELVAKGLAYLASQQADDGSFKESKDFYYSAYKKPLTLTASILLAFAETEELAAPHVATMDKAFQYLLTNLEECNDLHVKTLVTYALHKIGHDKTTELLGKLQELAKSDSDRQWWTDRVEKPKAKRHWWWWCFSHDVEITAYMLLALLDTASIQDVLPIVKWLIAQRNSYGGFTSTQDTVVGLQALIKFAEKSNYEAAAMNIEFNAKGIAEKQDAIELNEENGLLLQTVELPAKTKAVDFSATGTGTALVQISYQYNIADKDKKPSFSIATTIKEGTPARRLEMDVCVAFTGDEDESNMALLELAMPSGFTVDSDNIENIKKISGVRLIETRNAESVMVIYFERLTKDEPKVLPIIALKSFAVALQKPSPIVLYDYYDTSKKATHYYEIVSQLSDICEQEEEQ